MSAPTRSATTSKTAYLRQQAALALTAEVETARLAAGRGRAAADYDSFLDYLEESRRPNPYSGIDEYLEAV